MTHYLIRGTKEGINLCRTFVIIGWEGCGGIPLKLLTVYVTCGGLQDGGRVTGMDLVVGGNVRYQLLGLLAIIVSFLQDGLFLSRLGAEADSSAAVAARCLVVQGTFTATFGQ